MDHRSYESWLLDDERLTAGQQRELRLHLLEVASGNGDVIDPRIGGAE